MLLSAEQTYQKRDNDGDQYHGGEWKEKRGMFTLIAEIPR